jgi:hypothetical protein
MSIGLQRAHLIHRLQTVTGLADDREILLGFQNHPEARTQQGLVVDQQDADSHELSFVRPCPGDQAWIGPILPCCPPSPSAGRTVSG